MTVTEVKPEVQLNLGSERSTQMDTEEEQPKVGPIKPQEVKMAQVRPKETKKDPKKIRARSPVIEEICGKFEKISSRRNELRRNGEFIWFSIMRTENAVFN